MIGFIETFVDMGKKDPAFLFYPSDWMGGTMTMTRHIKGCYIDLLVAQFNSGPLSLEEIKTVLGTDFAAWGSLSKKFKTTDDGLFFNERLATEKAKRSEFSNKQKERINKRWNKSGIESGNTAVLPKIENENGNGIKEGGVGETIKTLGTGKNFILIIPQRPGSYKYRVSGDDGLQEFFEMNGSILREPEQARKFLYSNNGKPYNDFRHLFNDYKNFCLKQLG